MSWEVIDYKFKKIIDKLPIQCKKKYAVFKYIVQAAGLDGVINSPGFHLERLKGKLQRYHSIRLNIAYRVIFEVNDQVKIIDIYEISKHKYED
jgi:plasmid maintenance system killer protein